MARALSLAPVGTSRCDIPAAEMSGGAWGKLADVLPRPTNRIGRLQDPAGRAAQLYRVVTPRQP